MIGWSLTKDGRTARVVRIGVFAAAVVGGSRASRGADATEIMAAGPIRDQCIAAKSALQKAEDYAGARDATYWTSFRAGQTDVATAYQLSLSASWPTSLATTENTIDASFAAILNSLSKYANQSKTYRTADIRSMLDKQIAKLDADSQTLMGVVPSAYYDATAAAPAPSDSTSTPAPSAPSASTNGLADLVPGTGFTSATAQPAATGSGAGADAKAIARWDVVPYQTFTGKLPVGVVAFHMAGVDRVEFSVNGGAWSAVRSMTQNPVTGIWEYSINVDASTLADGDAEVRAVVYPKAGIARVLGGAHDGTDASLVSGQYSLHVSANAKGTLSSVSKWVSPTGDDTTGDGTSAKPFATIRAAAASLGSTGDGATIYLAAGDYAYPSMSTPAATSARWLTLSAAPGVTADKVRIVSNSGGYGLATKLVHLKGLTVEAAELQDTTAAVFNRVWVEGCVLEGTGPLDATRFFPLGHWTGGIYVTESTIRKVKYPAYGHMLTRNTLIDTIGGDAFREPSGLVANCEVKNIVNLDDTHNDLVQFWDPTPRTGFENIVFYGLKAVQNIDAQALFVQQPGSTIHYDNFAFVNYLAYATIGGQWQNPGTHVLVWNSEFLSPPAALATNKGGLMFCDLDTRPTSVHDVSIRGTVLQRLNALQTGSEPSLTDTSWASDNHYVDVTSWLSLSVGANATTGGSTTTLFVDPANGDFTPLATSPLVSRLQTLLVPADGGLRVRKSPDAVGAVGATQ